MEKTKGITKDYKERERLENTPRDIFFNRLFIALSILIAIFAISAIVWGVSHTMNIIEARKYA